MTKLPYEPAEVVVPAEAIASRMPALAAEIVAAYGDGAEGIVIVPVMTGAFVFAADLVRRMPNRLRVDVATVRSYGGGTVSQGPRIEGVMPSVQGLVDDILESGLTLSFARQLLLERGATHVSICTLLDKPGKRKTTLEADFVGFECGDEFLVGYGLDWAHRFRGLPYIGVVEKPGA